nr:MAG TPA: DNA polymerase [Crassvirales sp.]
MIIRNKTVITYDIEIFPNVFHCVCKDTESGKIYLFEISNRKNQLKELVDFFGNSNFMFCGYNNKHYDDVIMNYIINLFSVIQNKTVKIITESLFKLSQTIITSEEGDINRFKKWKYLQYFYSMDLLTMQFSKKLRVGLKSMQVTMHYKNVQEYEGDFNDWLPDSEIDSMIKYNINDVDSTTELLNLLKSDIDLREFIKKEYGIDALSMDGVKIGETLLLNKYCELTNFNKRYVESLRSPMDYVELRDVILPTINYKNQILQDVLEDMKKQVVYTKERKGYEKKFVLSDTCYSIGVGGIHSLHSPRIFTPEPGEYIGHSDVASMYPSFIIQYEWIPQHLGKDFWQVYKNVYDERINAKHTGQKQKNLVLKLALNAVTGKMQEETSWLYDPLQVFKIRINGQLVLLMLADRLIELGCKIVQVNTDGVVYIAKKDNKLKVQEAISEIEQLTRLNFETDQYEAFYQYAGNDYFGIIDGFSQSRDEKLIEKKGMFITNTNLGKGLAPVIIPKAVINYFITKQPVSEFIKNSTDIRDFLMSQRCDKKFKVVHGKTPVQRINRFYAATNDYSLYKISPEGKETNMLTKSGVTILNTLDDKPITDRHLNYMYYISEAKKIIHAFEHRQLDLFGDPTW